MAINQFMLFTTCFETILLFYHAPSNH